MLWCPELVANFVNGIDPETGIKEHAYDGQIPEGLKQGWFWTNLIWTLKKPERRQIAYKSAKAQGWTHFAFSVYGLTVGDTREESYHGLRPNSQEDCDNHGALLNTIHAEVLANGLIPVCMGCAIDTPPAPGFDGAQVLIAGDDWDDRAEKDGNIKALSEYFPNALIYVEFGDGMVLPNPDAYSKPFSTGGEWIRNAQQQWPRFTGVFYEASNWADFEGAIVNIQAAHDAGIRDCQEVLFETNTNQLFWRGGGINSENAKNDETLKRLTYLKGCMSGSAPHPPPADNPTVGIDGELDLHQVKFIDGPSDIADWKEVVKITKVDLGITGVRVRTEPSSYVEDGSPWPLANGGWNMSLGMAVKRNGQWYAAAPLECWPGLLNLDNSSATGNGGNIANYSLDAGSGVLGQVANNWFDKSRWNELHLVQPQPGEQIGIFIVAGDFRSHIYGLRERSNIVLVTMP